MLVLHASADLYGSDRTLLESVRALRAAGCTVVVGLPEDGPLVAELTRTGADVRVVPMAKLRKADMSTPGLLRLVARVARVAWANRTLLRTTSPDVVYVNTVAIPLWLLLARLAGIPAVCHVHEAEEALPRPVALALVLPLLLARGVVVNSQATRRHLMHTLPGLGRRATVVYNGVPGPEVTPHVRGGPQEPVRLVLIGRLSTRKGTDVAIDAVVDLVRQGRDVRLNLVGAPPPGADLVEEEMRARVARNGLQSQIHFSGFVKDVWAELDRADIVLVPSLVESFGNVAVEAALAARPVVASDLQGLQEIVVNGKTGLLVPPSDAVALASAVVGLLDDWAAAQGMALEAQARAAHRFGVARYAAELVSVLEQAAGRAG